MRTLIFLSLFCCFSAHAFEGHIFGYGTQIHSDEMNTSLIGQSLKPMYNLPGFGAEVDAEAGKLRIGLRYTSIHYHVGDGSGGLITADNGFSELDATMIQLMLRIIIAQSGFGRFEIFGGAGGVQATVDSKANGIEDKQGINDFQSMQSAGAAIMLGAKHVYFKVEGGLQWALVKNLEQSDTTQPKISKIDLTGPFVTVGIVVQTDMLGGGSGSSSSSSKSSGK